MSEREDQSQEKIIENYERITNRMHAIKNILKKLFQTASKREGKREILLQTISETEKGIIRLKLLKSNVA